MSYVVEVEQKLRDVLQENLTDLNRNRRGSGKDFVFTDKPDLNTKKPYLLISILDNQKSGYSLGSTDTEYLQRIQVSIRVGKTNSFEIDNTQRSSGYTKKYLSERCDEIVQDKISELQIDDDVFNIRPDSDNPQSPGNVTATANDYILFKRRK